MNQYPTPSTSSTNSNNSLYPASANQNTAMPSDGNGSIFPNNINTVNNISNQLLSSEDLYQDLNNFDGFLDMDPLISIGVTMSGNGNALSSDMNRASNISNQLLLFEDLNPFSPDSQTNGSDDWNIFTTQQSSLIEKQHEDAINFDIYADVNEETSSKENVEKLIQDLESTLEKTDENIKYLTNLNFINQLIRTNQLDTYIGSELVNHTNDFKDFTNEKNYPLISSIFENMSFVILKHELETFEKFSNKFDEIKINFGKGICKSFIRQIKDLNKVNNVFRQFEKYVISTKLYKEEIQRFKVNYFQPILDELFNGEPEQAQLSNQGISLDNELVDFNNEFTNEPFEYLEPTQQQPAQQQAQMTNKNLENEKFFLSNEAKNLSENLSFLIKKFEKIIRSKVATSINCKLYSGTINMCDEYTKLKSILGKNDKEIIEEQFLKLFKLFLEKQVGYWPILSGISTPHKNRINELYERVMTLLKYENISNAVEAYHYKVLTNFTIANYQEKNYKKISKNYHNLIKFRFKFLNKILIDIMFKPEEVSQGNCLTKKMDSNLIIKKADSIDMQYKLSNLGLLTKVITEARNISVEQRAYYDEIIKITYKNYEVNKSGLSKIEHKNFKDKSLELFKKMLNNGYGLNFIIENMSANRIEIVKKIYKMVLMPLSHEVAENASKNFINNLFAERNNIRVEKGTQTNQYNRTSSLKSKHDRFNDVIINDILKEKKRQEASLRFISHNNQDIANTKKNEQQTKKRGRDDDDFQPPSTSQYSVASTSSKRAKMGTSTSASISEATIQSTTIEPV